MSLDIGNVKAMQCFSFGTDEAWDDVGDIEAAEQDVTVPGLEVGDVVYVSKPTAQAGLGVVGARVSADNTLSITFTNPTAADITPTPNEKWLGVVFKAAQPILADATI